MSVAELPSGIDAAIKAYLDAVPVEAPKARKRRPTSGRLRPDLRLMELFADWQAVMQPSLQSAHEYEGATRDFIDFLGDVTVEEIVNNDLLDYRYEAAHLPASMPRADRGGRRPCGNISDRRSTLALPRNRRRNLVPCGTGLRFDAGEPLPFGHTLLVGG